MWMAITWPSAAARMDPPAGAARSMPLWKPEAFGPMRRRGPYGEVTQVGETGRVRLAGPGRAMAG